MEHIILVTEMALKSNKLFSNFKVSRPTCLSSLLKLYVAYSILSNLPHIIASPSLNPPPSTPSQDNLYMSPLFISICIRYITQQCIQINTRN